MQTCKHDEFLHVDLVCPLWFLTGLMYDDAGIRFTPISRDEEGSALSILCLAGSNRR